MKKKILNTLLWSLIVIGLIIVIWLVAFLVTKNEYLIPSISLTFKQIFTYLKDKSFYSGLGHTLLRSFIGFIISFILALLCSILSIRFKNFKKLLSPIISIIRAIPTMAITLLLLIYFSPKLTPTIITIMVLFPMLYTLFLSSYNNIDNKYFVLAKAYKLSNKQILNKIIIPNAAPIILDNIGSNISFAIKLTISAEVLAKTYNSLGCLLNDAKLFGETAASLFALTIITIVISLFIEFIFHIIARNSFKKWRVKNDQD